MTVLRRALAVLPIGVLATAAAAAPAGAAALKTDACVRYVAGQPTMNILGSGFTPNGFVTIGTATRAKPVPTTFTSSIGAGQRRLPEDHAAAAVQRTDAQQGVLHARRRGHHEPDGHRHDPGSGRALRADHEPDAQATDVARHLHRAWLHDG